MLFTLYACADVDGEKYNFELAFFGGPPTLQDLHTRIVEVFSSAAAQVRGSAVAREFIVENVVAHCHGTKGWVDLENASQLVPNMQLYVFQPGSDGVDLSKPLPAPLLPPSAMPTVPPPSSSSRVIMPPGGGGASSSAVRSRSPYSDVRSGRYATPPRATPRSSSPRPGPAPATRSIPSPAGSPSRYYPQQHQQQRVDIGPRRSNGDAPYLSRQRSVAEPPPTPAASAAASGGEGVYVQTRPPPPPRVYANRAATMEVFSLLDTDFDGIVSLRQLRDAMLIHSMDVSVDNVGDTFSWGDRAVSAAEFAAFGEHYPHVVNELLHAMRVAQRAKAAPAPSEASAPRFLLPPEPRYYQPPSSSVQSINVSSSSVSEASSMPHAYYGRPDAVSAQRSAVAPYSSSYAAAEELPVRPAGPSYVSSADAGTADDDSRRPPPPPPQRLPPSRVPPAGTISPPKFRPPPPDDPQWLPRVEDRNVSPQRRSVSGRAQDSGLLASEGRGGDRSSNLSEYRPPPHSFAQQRPPPVSPAVAAPSTTTPSHFHDDPLIAEEERLLWQLEEIRRQRASRGGSGSRNAF